ncbi:SDR family NAD(P)-dependent oxidoreductase [Rhodococcus sp. NPDC058521]|uniref:type I polyketide synthase n=1 Tax=Rhodococcus sp. NPDC058521 TaxID=3346536 RepID=UPI00365C7EEE
MVEVAIVGIGCRFPGGIDDPASFWQFLMDKGDGIVEVPEDRWSLEKFYDPDPDAPGRMYTKKGGFLTQSLWDFDPEFFGISPREASIMDPQQRLLLEVAWEALDDAGMAARVGGRSVGVYVGGFTNDSAYARVAASARASINLHTPTSSSFTLLSNRISYALDLQGPSMTIDTACSSSLVAFHEATQAIARGECEVALVGGVNAMIQPETFISMCKGRFLAVDGRSKTFDAAADGYGRGEGAGMVLLKPLDAARADGDRIYAVVRGTGSNQDGRTLAIPVPNPVSQQHLAERVSAEAGIAPHEVSYVEAHGTGTSVGDPLELSALGNAYGAVEGRRDPLVVGSIKASIGHTEAAAGVASVIKAALTLHHRTVAPQGWLDTLNPEIPFDDLNLRVPTEPEPLTLNGQRAAVAVNGFGYGGTNAHVLMTEAPEPTVVVEHEKPVVSLFPLSARNDAAARDLATRTADALASCSPDEFGSFVTAAWSRRAHHPARIAFPFTDRDDLVAQLAEFAEGAGSATTRALPDGAARPVFVFSGMGPQWWAMGRQLLNAEGAFADEARRIDAEFVKITGWSIIEELLREEDESRIPRTEFAQPANFLVQAALVAELASVGVHPHTVLGHSVGEVTAAYVSGALSLHDALLVSFHRSRLQATTAGTGGMLAVGLSAEDAATWLDGDPDGASISIAAVNSPSATTLAGDDETIARWQERFTEAGIFARTLKVEVPYHSHLMNPILDEIRESLASLVPRTPTLPLFSTVTGEEVAEVSWGPQYWCDNVREPVRFADTVAAVVGRGHRLFLEIGPHPVLGGNIREILVRAGENGTSIGTLVRGEDDRASMLRALGNLYAHGALDSSRAPGLSSISTPHVPLPAYPWQRTRLWTEDQAITKDRLGVAGTFSMLGERTDSAADEWEVQLSATRFPWLPDHVVNGRVVLPGAAYLDAALSAACARTGNETLSLESVEFVVPLVLDEHDIPVVRLSVEESTRRVTIRSRQATSTNWTVHATGRLRQGALDPVMAEPVDTEGFTRIAGTDLYAGLSAAGLSYGSAFQGIESAEVGDGIVVADIDSAIASAGNHLAHPAVVDTALQCVAALIASGSAGAGATVPSSVDSIRRYRPLAAASRVVVRRRTISPFTADISISDRSGNVSVDMAGVEFRPISPSAPLHSQLDPIFYEPEWELRDNRRSTAPVSGEFALVVALGSETSRNAQHIADAHPNSIITNIVEPVTEDVAEHLGALIAEGLNTAETARVVVVAGTEFDAVQNVHAIVEVAKAISLVIHAEDETASAAERQRTVSAVIVAERGFCLPSDVDGAAPAHSALTGARRSLRNEQPQAQWRFVDTDSDTGAAELTAEVFGDGSEVEDVADEVCLRQGARWVLRVRRTLADHLGVRQQAAVMTDPEKSFTLEVPKSKLISDVGLRTVERVAPKAGQIEIEMKTVGLNYKDPLKIMGLLTEKDLAGTYFDTFAGMEGAGVVTRVGDGVDHLSPGDLVAVCARNMISRYLTIDADEGATMLAAPNTVPDHCSSTLPFMTSEIGLLRLARLEASETVLVHGAAGGVGLAAIQVAKRYGATVIATAGTDDRRRQVLEAGADHALNSRSLNFVEEVLALTDGEGVDVVLNSAPGEIVQQNFRVAAEFARIVEIGKADIYGGGVLELKPFDRNLSYFAVDVDRMLAKRPEVVRSVMRGVNAALGDGTYTNLPFEKFSLADLDKAFEAVVRASRNGRVVLALDDPEPPVLPAIPTVAVDPEGSYLVTGGFGAFGLATARWLVAEGAKHLILVGRSGASTHQAKAQVDEFVSAGVEVITERVDVSDYAQVRDAVTRAQTSGHPLRGVFHTAGVVNNLPVHQVTLESLEEVFAPKVQGALNLDRAVEELGADLSLFVLFSSVSALTGGAPQLAYSAANSVLDALAWTRRSQGKPGLTISWGSMAGGGMAEATEEVVRFLALLGFTPIDMDAATLYMRECLALGIPHVAVMDVDWKQWTLTNHPSATNPRFSEHVEAAGEGASGASALQAEILALPEEQRGEVVTYILAEQLAVVMGVPAESVDVVTPLPDLGMDSLMAVEFAARAGKTLGMDISALEMGRGLGLSDVGTKMAAHLASQGPRSDAGSTLAPATTAGAPATEKPVDAGELAGAVE